MVPNRILCWTWKHNSGSRGGPWGAQLPLRPPLSQGLDPVLKYDVSWLLYMQSTSEWTRHKCALSPVLLSIDVSDWKGTVCNLVLLRYWVFLPFQFSLTPLSTKLFYIWSNVDAAGRWSVNNFLISRVKQLGVYLAQASASASRAPV